jgi:hypothetical protein
VTYLLQLFYDHLNIYFKLLSIIFNHTCLQHYQIKKLKSVTTKKQIIRIINTDIDDSGKIIYKQTVNTYEELETYLTTLFATQLRIIEITKMINKEGHTFINNIILNLTKKYINYENNYKMLIDILRKQ